MKREDITKRAINIRRIRLEREKAIFMKLGSKIKAYFFYRYSGYCAGLHDLLSRL